MVFVLGVVLAMALAAGTAFAEPGKNQITSTAECSNGETYTFTINAMGKSGQLEGTTSNLQIKSYTLNYFDPETGDPLAVIEYGGGKKKGQQGDLITCEGENTTEIFRFGLVRIVFELEAFVTPRGK
jgi:hypothetical protein